MAINLDFSGFHSILVDVDALGQQHPALDAALELATRCHAKVKIVDVVVIAQLVVLSSLARQPMIRPISPR